MPKIAFTLTTDLDLITKITKMAEVRLARHEVEKNLLPMICVQCGAPATHYESKRLESGTWMWLPIMMGMAVSLFAACLLSGEKHPWVFYTILLGGVGLSAMLGQRLIPHVKVDLPWCEPHWNTWRSISIEAHNITHEGFILSGVSEEFAKAVLLASSPNSLVSTNPPDSPKPRRSSDPPQDKFFDPDK
jgi:hypothetical protein